MRKLNLNKRAAHGNMDVDDMIREVGMWSAAFLGKPNFTHVFISAMAYATRRRIGNEKGRMSKEKAQCYMMYIKDVITAHEYTFKYNQHMCECITLGCEWFVENDLYAEPKSRNGPEKADALFAGRGFGYVRDRNFVPGIRLSLQKNLHDYMLESIGYDTTFWNTLFAMEACGCKFLYVRTAPHSLDRLCNFVRNLVQSTALTNRADVVEFCWQAVCEEWQLS